MKKYQIICNWKNYLSFKESEAFCRNYANKLSDLTAHANVTLTICPSMESLATIKNIFFDTEIKLGAQDCSQYGIGAHTGEVSATSLGQIGIDVCLIGHSERRIEYAETTEMLQRKIIELFTQKEHLISPVICIGETKDEYQSGFAQKVLEDQLRPLMQTVQKYNLGNIPVYIAYEPVWAIGTGNIPNIDELQKIFSFLSNLCTNFMQNQTIYFLYGGSVDEKNAIQLALIKDIHGYLIGGASIDFQKLRKIVSLVIDLIN